jgi:hypothetical protein
MVDDAPAEHVRRPEVGPEALAIARGWCDEGPGEQRNQQHHGGDEEAHRNSPYSVCHCQPHPRPGPTKPAVPWLLDLAAALSFPSVCAAARTTGAECCTIAAGPD